MENLLPTPETAMANFGKISTTHTCSRLTSKIAPQVDTPPRRLRSGDGWLCHGRSGSKLVKLVAKKHPEAFENTSVRSGVPLGTAVYVVASEESPGIPNNARAGALNTKTPPEDPRESVDHGACRRPC